MAIPFCRGTFQSFFFFFETDHCQISGALTSFWSLLHLGIKLLGILSCAGGYGLGMSKLTCYLANNASHLFVPADLSANVKRVRPEDLCCRGAANGDVSSFGSQL